MLTVDFDRLGVRPGHRLLDMGCGGGRHAFEARRRGAHVVAVDAADTEAKQVAGILTAMTEEGEAGPAGSGAAVVADGAALPFADGAFDAVIAAEVLEHVADDRPAVAELTRVLRPGGRLAVTVPRWYPERLNWALSREYHDVPGGHVRVYRRSVLARRLADAGLRGLGASHAHALHTPWWWLRCAVGVGREDQPLVRAYHRALVWEITHPGSPLRAVERALDPVLGKSLVLYVEKPC